MMPAGITPGPKGAPDNLVGAPVHARGLTLAVSQPLGAPARLPLASARADRAGLDCRTFSTTNAIENMNGTLRRICRNVKRWRGEKMIRRWIALGIAEAQKRFRRVKGHEQLSALVAALRPTTTTETVTLEKKSKAA